MWRPQSRAESVGAARVQAMRAALTRDEQPNRMAASRLHSQWSRDHSAKGGASLFHVKHRPLEVELAPAVARRVGMLRWSRGRARTSAPHVVSRETCWAAMAQT